MHRKEKIEKIAELFARFRTEVESLNSLNLYDINVHAENVIIPILNLVYGVNCKHPIKYTLYFHKIENSISTLVKS